MAFPRGILLLFILVTRVWSQGTYEDDYNHFNFPDRSGPVHMYSDIPVYKEGAPLQLLWETTYMSVDILLVQDNGTVSTLSGTFVVYHSLAFLNYFLTTL